MYANSVIPIYAFDAFKKKYHSVGSGTLVCHLNKELLVSAAHVFEKLTKFKTFIFLNNKLYELGNAKAYLWNTGDQFNGKREDDPIDLGVMQLPPQLGNETKKIKFVTKEEYEKGLRYNLNFYQALGFPSSKNSKLANKTAREIGEFQTAGIRYTVQDVSYSFFPHSKFDAEFHIPVCLTQKGFEAKTRNHIDLPELKGLSGGLLQSVTDYSADKDNFSSAFPVGIIIEKTIEKRAFVAVKLGLLFKWLDFAQKNYSIFK